MKNSDNPSSRYFFFLYQHMCHFRYMGGANSFDSSFFFFFGGFGSMFYDFKQQLKRY